MHIAEDQETLTKSMESILKLCIQRLSTSDSKNSRKVDGAPPSTIPLESFIGVITPLLYRNEEIFMSVFKNQMKLFEHKGIVMVGINEKKIA